MAEILIDGFRFAKWALGELLIIESGRLNECVAYCNEKRIAWVSISQYHGYRLNDIDFLRDCKHVTRVHVQNSYPDMRGLYGLPRLSWLSVIFQHRIDFSAFPQLIDLSTEWNPQIDRSLFSLKLLKRLWLSGYKPKDRTLACFEAVPSIKDLHIIMSSILSVRGVESLRELEKLDLSYCRQLVDIEPLAGIAETLNELEVGHCKNIPDLTRLMMLKNLRRLILFDSGSVPSLAFVKDMPRLESLSFINVKVVDGDMTPCFNLRYAGFRDKRHYSHTHVQVRREIERHTNGNSLYKD